MEMIGHEAVGENPDLTEFFVEAHEPEKLQFFLIEQNEATIDDSGDAVIISCLMEMSRFKPWLAHVKKVEGMSCVANVFLIKGQTL